MRRLFFFITSAALVNCESDVYFFDGSLAEGSPCTTSSGYTGTCTKFHYCPEKYRTTSSRNICSIDNGIKVICCETRRKKSSLSFLNELAEDEDLKVLFNDVDIVEVRKAKRLCEQKFDEYMKRIFPVDSNELDSLNGRELTSPGQYPHMSAIGIKIDYQNVEWKCGGSLISESFVLTAAHCTDFNSQAPDVVSIGDLNLRVREATVEPQVFGIERIVVYPNYAKSSYYHDIALIQLSREAIFTMFVRPACLWSKQDIPHNSVVAMGYGSTVFGRARTNKLTEVKLTVINNGICNRKLPWTHKARIGVISSQLCAADLTGDSDTCQGDSGGPLQLNIAKSGRIEYFLVGITSYGINCGSQYPGVYTRIHSFLDWIENIVWK